MSQNPDSCLLHVRVAQNAVRKDDCHLSTRLQEPVALLDEENLRGIALKLISGPLYDCRVNFNLGTEWRVCEDHVELALGVVISSRKTEILVCAVLNAVHYRRGNLADIRLVSVRIVKGVYIEDV